jgi:hypothetical protein
MKTFTLNKCFLVSLFVISVWACNVEHPVVPAELEKSFTKIFELDDLNTSISLQIDTNQEITFDSDLYLVIRNTSSKPIYIPESRESFRLFIIDENEWVEISNKIQYIGAESTLDTEGKSSSTLHTLVIPHLPEELRNVDGKLILRILFIGEKDSSQENQRVPVGAYTDVYIYK